MGRSSESGADDPVGRTALDDATAERREAADEVLGYAPLVDHDALDARSVVVEICVPRSEIEAVTERLTDRAVSVFEVTGRPNVLAVCRFGDGDRREAFLAELATDDRVDDVTVSGVLRTVVEGDTRGLF